MYSRVPPNGIRLVGEVRRRNTPRTPQKAHLQMWWHNAHQTPQQAHLKMRRHTTHRTPQRLTLFSSRSRQRKMPRFHYETLEGGHRTRTSLGQSPQLNWRLPRINKATKAQGLKQSPQLNWRPQATTKPTRVPRTQG